MANVAAIFGVILVAIILALLFYGWRYYHLRKLCRQRLQRGEPGGASSPELNFWFCCPCCADEDESSRELAVEAAIRQNHRENDPTFQVYKFARDREDERTRPPELEAVEAVRDRPSELEATEPAKELHAEPVIREMEVPLEELRPEASKMSSAGRRAELDGAHIPER